MSEEKNNDNIIVDIEKYDEKVDDGKVNEDNFWLTNKYKVTVTDGDKENSYIIADTSEYNIAINYTENDIHHGTNTSFDKKYTITEYNNKKKEKTSKQQTFMFHYNNPALDKETTDGKETKDNIAKKIKQDSRMEKYNDIVRILDKSGYHKLKDENITINETTKTLDENNKYINKTDTFNIKMYDDKRYSIYSMNNFLSRIALKTKQIGRWFSDAWTSLKWRFMDWNAPAKTNLNDINKGKNANIDK